MSDQESRQEQEQSPLLTYADGGKPFSSQKSAENCQEALGMKETHKVIKVDGGYALAPLSALRKQFSSQPTETVKSSALRAEPAMTKIASKLTEGEKVFLVRFHAKAHPNDPDDVVLSVNGDVLVIKREEEIPLLGRYVECARHATFPQFRQLPGQQRKVVAKVQKYQFDILGESTIEEFRKVRQVGTAQAAEVAKNMSVA